MTNNVSATSKSNQEYKVGHDQLELRMNIWDMRQPGVCTESSHDLHPYTSIQ
jgi:hypothetical protein